MSIPQFHTPEDYLLYRDALILVVNKPSGYAVQNGKGQSKNLLPLYEGLKFGLPKTPAPAHRLDAATSGCLILGRHRQASIRLGKLFERNKIKKSYIAVIMGHFPDDSGDISLPIGPQNERKDSWLMKIDHDNGQDATTHYEVLQKSDEASIVRLWPITGRTHQLRVHCAAMDAPIYGDWVYGGDPDCHYGLCLHAESLEIPLYPSKPPIIVTAPLPKHIEDLFEDAP